MYIGVSDLLLSDMILVTGKFPCNLLGLRIKTSGMPSPEQPQYSFYYISMATCYFVCVCDSWSDHNDIYS